MTRGHVIDCLIYINYRRDVKKYFLREKRRFASEIAFSRPFAPSPPPPARKEAGPDRRRSIQRTFRACRAPSSQTSFAFEVCDFCHTPQGAKRSLSPQPSASPCPNHRRPPRGAASAERDQQLYISVFIYYFTTSRSSEAERAKRESLAVPLWHSDCRPLCRQTSRPQPPIRRRGGEDWGLTRPVGFVSVPGNICKRGWCPAQISMCGGLKKSRF